MGKEYFVVFSEESGEDIKNLSLGRYCNDGQFHFCHHRMLGYTGSPVYCWRRVISETNAKIVSESGREIEAETFFEKIEKTGYSEEYLMTSIHK